MSLKNYPSIAHLKNIYRDLQYLPGIVAENESLHFLGTVKLHGTHGDVCKLQDKLQIQSRNRILTEKEDNLNFAKFVNQRCAIDCRASRGHSSRHDVQSDSDKAAQSMLPEPANCNIGACFILNCCSCPVHFIFLLVLAEVLADEWLLGPGPWAFLPVTHSCWAASCWPAPSGTVV
jgi:hypothetical protein